MKAIKNDKVTAAVGTAFTIAAFTGLVVSGLNKSEKIAVTAEMESVEEAETKEVKELSAVLSLESRDNILVGTPFDEFIEGVTTAQATSGQQETVLEETTVEETTVAETETATEPQTEQETTQPYEYENTFLVNVDEYLNVRQEASVDSAVVGKIYQGGGGQVLEKGAEWSKIQSGNVVGYIKNEYVWFSHDAEANMAKECSLMATVNVDSLRLRKGAGTDYKIADVVKNGTQLEAVSNEGDWIAVSYGGNTVYASAQYLTLKYQMGAGITIEEEQAAIAEEKRRQEEEAEKARLAQEAAEAQRRKNIENAEIPETIYTSAYSVTEEDAYLLSCLVMAEAGGECYEGKLAVANIVLNRLASGRYGDSISDVIYARGQFSVVNNGALDKYLSKGPNSACVRAATEALSGTNNVPGYGFFCTTKVANYSRYKSYSIIGNQVFYK